MPLADQDAQQVGMAPGRLAREVVRCVAVNYGWPASRWQLAGAAGSAGSAVTTTVGRED